MDDYSGPRYTFIMATRTRRASISAETLALAAAYRARDLAAAAAHLAAGETLMTCPTSALGKGDEVISTSGFRRTVTGWPVQTRAGGWIVATVRTDGRPWVAGVDSADLSSHISDTSFVVKRPA